MINATTTYGPTFTLEFHEVEFAGLKCWATELPDVGVVLRLPGRVNVGGAFLRRADLDSRPAPTESYGILICDRVHPSSRLSFGTHSRIVVFPWVVGGTEGGWFVVDQVRLRNDLGEFDSESGAQLREGKGWELQYRVTCPRCRLEVERAMQPVFAERERQTIEAKNAGQR